MISASAYLTNDGLIGVQNGWFLGAVWSDGQPSAVPFTSTIYPFHQAFGINSTSHDHAPALKIPGRISSYDEIVVGFSGNGDGANTIAYGQGTVTVPVSSLTGGGYDSHRMNMSAEFKEQWDFHIVGYTSYYAHVAEGRGYGTRAVLSATDGSSDYLGFRYYPPVYGTDATYTMVYGTQYNWGYSGGHIVISSTEAISNSAITSHQGDDGIWITGVTGLIHDRT